ncbi:MAG: alpha amylase C-terminal domain-containing protein, partial [Firmicutes bacterium]|nr:alpha amylase C-terminal domain-containing protein [Bacillota bacterium]
GLGFNFKWNMGWMNDSLEYFQTDPICRRGVHHKLTFSITYAWSETFVLPISHDEVVHGKLSLLNKMPGEYDQKFAGLRAFYVYMMTHPGKKLLFMGCEFGQFIEWNEKQGLDWLLLDYDKHRRMQGFVRELNQLYLDTPAFWSQDNTWDGFTWINADDMDHNVYSYLRTGADGQTSLCILNLSGQEWRNVHIGVPEANYYERLLDTDMQRFGGSGRRRRKQYKVYHGQCHGQEQHLRLNLPPLSAIILERR